MSKFSEIKAREYLPHVYDGFLEMESLLEIQDNLLDSGLNEVDTLLSNQFVLTADQRAIEEYERVLNIIPNPTNETLEFRRQRILNRFSLNPPYTMMWLRNTMDRLIGKGNWDGYVDYENYTLYIESSAKDQSWFNEIAITINSTKPANIVFINMPLDVKSFFMSEEISYENMEYMYKLDGTWKLGEYPFARYFGGGTVKMPEQSSLTPTYFNKVLNFTADDIKSVVINDDISINTFLSRKVEGSKLTITYEVKRSQATEVSSVKFLDGANNVLAQSFVYVPLAEDITMKHVISVYENGGGRTE